MAAAAQDGALVHAIAAELANSGRWPEWRADADYAAERAESAEARVR